MAINKKEALKDFARNVFGYRLSVFAHQFSDYDKELVENARKELVDKFNVCNEEIYWTEVDANEAFDALVKALTGDEDGEYARLEEFRKFFPNWRGLSHNFWTREYIKAVLDGAVQGDY